jgi:hypothetical protein
MQRDSKKLKRLALGLSLLASGFLLFDALFMDTIGARPSPLSYDALAILKAILIFMSVYSFAVAWFFQFRRAIISNRLTRRHSRLSPEANFLLINYLLLISPVLFGLFLYVCGMPLREYFYFLGVSIAMMLAWGIYDLRKI